MTLKRAAVAAETVPRPAVLSCRAPERARVAHARPVRPFPAPSVPNHRRRRCLTVNLASPPSQRRHVRACVRGVWHGSRPDVAAAARTPTGPWRTRHRRLRPSANRRRSTSAADRGAAACRAPAQRSPRPRHADAGRPGGLRNSSVTVRSAGIRRGVSYDFGV